ncbi:hypothetical protein [Microseira wollei]|uniref:Crocagin biosynthetic protein CgnE/B domain-containing protein n=1 Tax=Microseira wollei NIES-4236 TaxID=2530354 RepID=A0AAV3WI33_9CYAN|nr:hypothetical protein [Microseira wollei]GET38949.1 hypothetical protein MiSe_37090 [Microseira wollei NIES-4236]
MDIRYFYQTLIAKEMPILVDRDPVNTYLREQGYQTILFDDYDFTRKQAVFAIISDYHYHDRLIELSQTSESTVVHLLAVRYDPSLKAIAYSFEQLLSGNLEQALGLRAKAYDKIAEAEEALYLSDLRGSKLKCYLSESLEVLNTTDELNSGWFYSIAEFWESSLVNIKGNKSSFSVEGTFFFDGIIYACANPVVRDGNREALTYLLNRVASSEEKYVEFEDNAITRLVIDGRDETSILLNMNYELERNLTLTEIGFGCNTALVKNIDWQVNSLMNQGMYGMHLGIGMAQKCPYIDFISQTIKLVED